MREALIKEGVIVMAPVIPMNAKTTRFTDLGRYYLLYTCPNCGETGLSEQSLRKEEERHFLRLEHMSNPELDKAAPPARPASDTERDRVSDAMAKQLAEGDFSTLEAKVVCPRCGTVQPWSGLGKPWFRTLLALFTAAVIVASLIWLRYIASARTGNPLLPLIPMAVMILLSLGYVLRRRSRLAALRQSAEHRPTFYSRAALRTLAEGPYKALVKPYLTKE